MSGMQFLQVPKALPCRRSRSRSKPRSQDPVAVEERCYSRKVNAPASRPGSPQLQVLPPPLFKTLSGMTEGTIYTLHQHKWTSPIEKRFDYKHDKLQPVVAVKAMVSADSPPSPAKVMSHHAVKVATPQPTLRDKIIGTWKLESYAAHPTPESTIKRTTYPMTTKVTGLIMYTPDGYMSAQMLIPGQQSFKRGEGEEPQWAEAAKRSFTYCGPYYITDEGPGREEVLRHTFQFCNLPGWIGDIQVRTHKFEEDGQVLVLGSEEPAEIKGDKRIPVLKWRRARDNANGVPPPPTPSITISGPTEI